MDDISHLSSEYRQLSRHLGWGDENLPPDDTKISIIDNYVTGKKVLDIGCAVGKYSAYLSDKGFAVIGIDNNKELIKIAKKNAPSAKFVCDNVISGKLSTQKADSIVAFDILEHLPEKEALNCWLKTGASRFIFTVPHTTNPLLSEIFLLYGHHLDPTHLRTYDRKSARRLLSAFGLKPVAITPIHPLSTDEIFIRLFSGPHLVKRLCRKICFTLLTPRYFHTNLLIVADRVSKTI